MIDAALAVLDAVGLDALTMRKIADQLGVRVGALYWHVHGKHEVLVALAGRILAETHLDQPATGTPAGWRDHLRDTAFRLRAAMLRHRDAARLIAGYAPLSPITLREAETYLRLAAEDGLALDTAAFGGDTLMGFVTGFVLQEQSSPPPADPAESAEILRELPRLAQWNAQKPIDKSEAFRMGVETVIAGIDVHR
ncbi:TetR/AcrR family transcriptional regulator C-terminal domain-containing protein [Actinomadura scrupuli]|uniref:TetR/AcrR family transcriptional regulator C-terminal domain-containing protein n=1 Tax=Actinomadura scrupuli TaxID=559629 RepID=UPI003D983601